MIIDSNTWIGQWPFRPMPEQSATDLLRQMDKLGIDKALVGSLQGLFYQDAHQANIELAKEIARYRDRLVPCALINPMYLRWREDLKQCREEFGMPVLRIAPAYHRCRLSDTAPLVTAALELKMTVAVVRKMLSDWLTHWMDPGQDAEIGDEVSFLSKFPKASFLWMDAWDSPGGKRWDEPACYLDIVNKAGGCGMALPRALERYSADRVIFGTGMLMDYGRPAILAAEVCELTKAQRERIMWRNLADLIPELR